MDNSALVCPKFIFFRQLICWPPNFSWKCYVDVSTSIFRVLQLIIILESRSYMQCTILTPEKLREKGQFSISDSFSVFLWERIKVYSQWAIAIAIFAPLKWVLLNTIVLFTVSVCDSDVAITKSDMGVAPISSKANST